MLDPRHSLRILQRRLCLHAFDSLHSLHLLMRSCAVHSRTSLIGCLILWDDCSTPGAPGSEVTLTLKSEERGIFQTTLTRGSPPVVPIARRRRSDKVAAAASEVLRFYVKRGPPPQGDARVGIELARDANESMVVKRVQTCSPAEESGEIFAGNVVHYIEEDDLEGLSPAEAELYLYGADESCVNVTLSDGGSANRGNLRVVPLQRRLTDENGDFAVPADAVGRVGEQPREDGRDASLVRLVLDGNFESLLEGDQAAQQVYGSFVFVRDLCCAAACPLRRPMHCLVRLTACDMFAWCAACLSTTGIRLCGDIAQSLQVSRVYLSILCVCVSYVGDS